MNSGLTKEELLDLEIILDKEISSAAIIHGLDARQTEYLRTIKGKIVKREDHVMKVMIEGGAFIPERAHELDAGYDLKTPYSITIPAHGSGIIDTGVHMLIDKGYVGFLKSKSGLNVKFDLTGEGVIDAGYTGSIVVKLYNNGDKDRTFEWGDKIIQIVILPIYTPDLELVENLGETERGNSGFGSSGK